MKRTTNSHSADSTLVISGTVIVGDRRGRQLGFPTANLALDGARTPLAFGVYAGTKMGYLAAISIGVRPTFGKGLRPLVEVHILDFEGDLYGRWLEVVVGRYLHPEIAFDSVESLRRQIDQDIETVRGLARSR